MRDKEFFMDNMRIVKELAKYAPSDNKLLSIPSIINASNPLFTCLMPTMNDHNANYFLVASHILQYLQSANRTLSKVYASHQHIINNREIILPPHLKQTEIDHHMYIGSIIIEEHRHTLREFILMLRVAVDQLIILIMTLYKINEGPDSIGVYLNSIEKNLILDLGFDKRFLSALNIIANFMKHHPYQFEAPASTFHLMTPSLLVIVDAQKNKSKQDYQALKTTFQDELAYDGSDYATWWVSCDYLVSGFNQFFKTFTSTRITSNTNNTLSTSNA